MVGNGGSSAGSYLADPTSPIPSHCASIVATSTVRVNIGLMGTWQKAEGSMGEIQEGSGFGAQNAEGEGQRGSKQGDSQQGSNTARVHRGSLQAKNSSRPITSI